jgi:hypothetical protein
MVCRVGLALAYGGVLVLGGTASAYGESLWNGATGALTGWQSVAGSFVSVQDHTFAPASAGGVEYRLLLSTGSDDDDNANPPRYAVDASDVASFVGASVDVGGHPGFDAGGAVEGSAVKKTFTAHPGDVLSITYDFLTAEGSALYGYEGLSEAAAASDFPGSKDDFAFIAITHDGATTVTRLADVLTAPMFDDITGPSGFRYAYHTGFRSLQILLPTGPTLTDGTYTVSLGVMDGAADQSLPPELGRQIESALLVQSLDVSGPSAVPLPAAAPAGAVLVGMVAAIRRIRRR